MNVQGVSIPSLGGYRDSRGSSWPGSLPRHAGSSRCCLGPPQLHFLTKPPMCLSGCLYFSQFLHQNLLQGRSQDKVPGVANIAWDPAGEAAPCTQQHPGRVLTLALDIAPLGLGGLCWAETRSHLQAFIGQSWPVCMMLGLGLLSANLSSILLCGVGSPKYDIPVPPIWLAESSEVTLNPRERGAKQGGALPTACRHRP